PLVPTGQRGVVVAMIGHIPAEDDVAETEAAFDCGKEFVLVQVLSAQYAVDVGHRDLDAIAGACAHGVQDLARSDVLRHRIPRVWIAYCVELAARMARPSDVDCN